MAVDLNRRMLARNEPPNPTPARVRAARRDGQAMLLAARGVSAQEIAGCLGYTNDAAAKRAIERARDRVFPFDIADSILTERRVLHALMDSVMASVHPGAPQQQLDKATLLVLRSARLELRCRDAIRAMTEAERDPEWVDLCVIDLGDWTEPLSMRAHGRSFHDIADALGRDDFFDANQIVFTDLVHYENGCALQLRARQVAQLTRQLHDVWGAATRTPLVDLRAARRAMSILERRWHVRGIGLPFRGPLIDHSPNVHRNGL